MLNIIVKSFKQLRAASRTRGLSTMSLKYLNQAEATNIDVELFVDYKFSVDQLMELAGLACAHAIAKEFSVEQDENDKILVLAGPGNNGGDALVAARHLSLMKFKPSIYYPKRTEKPLFINLVNQCSMMGIPFLDSCPDVLNVSKNRLIVDGLFGFSFKPPVRPQFTDIIEILSSNTDIPPIVSIDIPSGWDVESGRGTNSINPYMLISLTAPKLCAKQFDGIHYLGGRFVPAQLAEKYQLNLPEYPGTESCMKLN